MSFLRSRASTRTGIPLEPGSDSPKESVKRKFIDSIKDLQVEYGEGNPSSAIGNNELTHSLVTAVEALFVHGLKDAFLGRRRGSGGNPEPNFWTFLLVFSHRDTIARLEKLTAIHCDAGRGRAWIRLALNEGLLGSYLSAMGADRASVRRHYQRHSILADQDLVDVFVRYLNGVEIYRFDLALNSGLLNRWTTGPLVLAGVLKNTHNEPPPVTAIDAASMLDENGCDPLAASTPFEVVARPPGYLNRGLMNEDEALKLILAGVSPANFSGSSSNTGSPAGTSPSSPLAIRKKRTSRNVHKAQHLQVTPRQSKPPSPTPPPTETKPEEPNHGATAAAAAEEEEQEEEEENVLVDNDVVVNNSNSSGGDKKKETTMMDSEVLLPPEKVDDPEKEHLTRIDTSMEFEDIYARKDGEESPVEEEEEELSPPHKKEDEDECTSQDTFVTCPQGGNNGASTPSSGEAKVDEIQVEKWPTKVEEKRPPVSLTPSSSRNLFVHVAVPYLAGFIDSWNPFGSGKYFDTPPEAPHDGQFGFTLRPDVRVGCLSVSDSQQLMLLFDQIVREMGLDVQNYECAECSRAIGTLFGPAKICAYTKRYYCEECHLDEAVVIPAKVMYNWDFRQFRVCHKAKLFLDSVNIEPIIDVKSFNADLYDFAPSLREVFDLRKQLRYMDAYLITCADSKSKAKATFDKMVWPRDYLHCRIDMYSVRDLEEINSGKLIAVLKATTKFARDHILGCVLCSGKGFICEVCKEDRPIYPFDLDQIMQCKECFTVFHLDCSVKIPKCPKCDRIEARNLNWHVSLVRSQRMIPT